MTPPKSKPPPLPEDALQAPPKAAAAKRILSPAGSVGRMVQPKPPSKAMPSAPQGSSAGASSSSDRIAPSKAAPPGTDRPKGSSKGWEQGVDREIITVKSTELANYGVDVFLNDRMPYILSSKPRRSSPDCVVASTTPGTRESPCHSPTATST